MNDDFYSKISALQDGINTEQCWGKLLTSNAAFHPERRTRIFWGPRAGSGQPGAAESQVPSDRRAPAGILRQPSSSWRTGP
jgi:hypothetical protein